MKVLRIPHNDLLRICTQTYFAARYAEDQTIPAIMEYNDMFIACASVFWHGDKIEHAYLYEMKSIPPRSYKTPSPHTSAGYEGCTKCRSMCLEFGQQLKAYPKA